MFDIERFRMSDPVSAARRVVDFFRLSVNTELGKKLRSGQVAFLQGHNMPFFMYLYTAIPPNVSVHVHTKRSQIVMI